MMIMADAFFLAFFSVLIPTLLARWLGWNAGAALLCGAGTLAMTVTAYVLWHRRTCYSCAVEKAERKARKRGGRL